MKSFSEKKLTKPKLKIKEVVLQGIDFILEFNNSSESYSEFPYLGRCDLYLPKTVNKGKYNERTDLKWVRSSDIESAINRIALYRILNSGDSMFKAKGDEGLSMFLSRFMEEKTKILSLFNHTKEEWMNILQCDKKKKSYKAILE